ncbi:FMN-binding protein MioC [Shewanella sp. Choline-02u-19]|uniref:FMN-binding protein MioC n=1 Tax=Shewanella TaxID=22 RepID=UPI000C327EB3|nr:MULTISPECIES: FMN-binding protein MioC [Shewanella]MCL1059484.1 FMN-binding protein MioC [Shewanella gelidimarina]PKG56049.1 FMN-binding protein MioC [Shewanella sp. GutDb-MelDb]PKG75545.1 FMN-binding protein MioC [Shewanella sp. GutCb]PKH60022.1 FMN-binding protein MioC [Shewanella sp. Bg11-22]PKI30703.1 FMN-binding protein MioC [Shewanella sp. Choline-02u-19]
MAKVELLVGTTLGSAEYVADEMSAQLNDLGHETIVHLAPNLDDLDPKSLWLIACSTHGAGDLPDNIVPFMDEILAKKPDLLTTQFALCAIGDSSYDTFCQGPEKLVEALALCGAQVFVDKIQIDVQYDPIPEEPALAWLSGWQDQL